MQPCIPHPFQGEGWIDDGKRRVGVNNAGGELGELLMMTQAVLLSSHSGSLVKEEEEEEKE